MVFRLFGSYILFPLTLLLDAAIACRARTDDKREHGHPWLGDKVAEHLLICLNILLDGCPCKTVPQVLCLCTKHVCFGTQAFATIAFWLISHYVSPVFRGAEFFQLTYILPQALSSFQHCLKLLELISR